MHRHMQTSTYCLIGKLTSETVYRLMETDQNSNKFIRKCDSIAIEQIVRPMQSLQKHAAMNHFKKNQNTLRRVTRMSRGICDVVAVLICFVSIVQTRPNSGSSHTYWYNNPCHHNSNQNYEFTRYSVTKDDMTRIKEQLNTSLGSVEESVKNFTTTIFGSSIKDFLDEWHNTGYSYVQSLHKGLVSPRKLSNNSMDEILKDLEMKELTSVHEEFYKLMKDYLKYYRRVAKAIDIMKNEIQENRIKYDQERLMLLNYIREDVRINLKQVLCEIYECVLKIDQDFVLNIIKEDEVLEWKEDYSDEMNRHLRDGFIYGDVVNTLEHILQFMRAYEKIWNGV
ncbi:uncharacterized protein LOC110678633 [Aedes aegypti]|uniref:Uncharacterized protein n=1 Tax=Aedes aegypti TaxID=7159 RepID=A0A6I8TXR9_AEDAE|nr:uncharacterized protein LOC110678633 [Aedes aegypti]